MNNGAESNKSKWFVRVGKLLFYIVALVTVVAIAGYIVYLFWDTKINDTSVENVIAVSFLLPILLFIVLLVRGLVRIRSANDYRMVKAALFLWVKVK